MTRRLLIHPGLHKTGTTTLQDTLRENREKLDPYVEMMLVRDPVQYLLTGACMQFSIRRNKEAKAIIREEATALFDALERDDPRPILLSNESLGGYPIGYKKVYSFIAMPIALSIIHKAWLDVMGENAPFEVYISTRREGWLRSCWWQRLKSERYRLPFDQFEKRYGKAADHAAFIELCKEHLPDVPIHSCHVEESGHPVKPVLALLGLSDHFDKLALAEARNVARAGDAHERLLALHRSDLKGRPYWQEIRKIMGREAPQDSE
ncbi:hypothetical protein [Celeribacter sp.]|uniref:hypothetical protein n=1 Tax=Celeribacter sp. TaxID=1890673 RepID=UPI003A8DAB8E